MDSCRLIFDSSPSHADHMFFIGDVGDSIFQGPGQLLVFEERANKRLPFLSTAEGLMEEECYELLTEKKRRLTAEQVRVLERSFEDESRLEPEKKNQLAKKLGLQPRQVAVWFQNRRARWKSKQLETDFHRLKCSYDALVATRDSLLMDNDRLRSQVLSLTEKLREKELATAGLQMSPTTVQRMGWEEDIQSAVIDNVAEALLADYIGTVDGVLGSEEDGGVCMDGYSYLRDGFVVEEAIEDNWSVWN